MSRPVDAFRLIRAARDVEDARLRAVDRHALLALATWAKADTGETWPAESALLAALGCSRSSLYERIRRLEQLGYVTSVRRRGKASLRVLNLPEKSDQPDVRPGARPASSTSDQPHIGRPTSRTSDVRPAGLSYVEPPVEPHKNTTPPNPLKGEPPPWPTLPRGNRQADHERYKTDCRAFAAHALPEVPLDRAAQLVEQAHERPRGLPATPTTDDFRGWPPARHLIGKATT